MIGITDITVLHSLISVFSSFFDHCFSFVKSREKNEVKKTTQILLKTNETKNLISNKELLTVTFFTIAFYLQKNQLSLQNDIPY